MFPIRCDEGIAEDQLVGAAAPEVGSLPGGGPSEEDHHRRRAAGGVHLYGLAEGERQLDGLACAEDPVLSRLAKGGRSNDPGSAWPSDVDGIVPSSLEL